MGLKVDGLSEFRAAFQRLRDKGGDTLSQATRDHMEQVVLPESMEKVPKATGALAGTGELRAGSRAGGWAVHFGDSPVNNREMVDYAAAVEVIDEHHHDPPTQAHFVEQPLKNSVPKLKERAAEKLDELARG
jgi:hypothetical protein